MQRQVLAWFDWWLFLAVIFLFSMGLIAIGSGELAQSGGSFAFLTKQTFAAVLGVIAAGVLITQPAVAYRQYAYLAWVSAVIGMVAVLFFGRTLNGARGWFVVGNFGIQPIEWAKIAFLLYASKILSEDDRYPLSRATVLRIGGMVGAMAILLQLQPDLGGALLFLGAAGVMVFLSGISWRWILGALGGGLVLFLLGWTVFFSQYQKDRISTFLNPAADPLSTGYNVNQAMIAIGSGGWFGRGFAGGSQSQLQFLPESQTDFIFAVIAEEFGFIGAGLVLLAFGFVVIRLFSTARASEDRFLRALLYGGGAFLCIPVFIHIGGNMGVLPVTGITLPLVSYGGTSLLMTSVLLGILFRASWEVRARTI